ncbi:hypothetical protein BATDEDRAFT_28498 [Batrachochytrium dendrobatidis JAM81]|uniref:Uncharacterized protein n=1 Tax=Batrachochytrium dendrobatidis (strain JAM81 / FGSC 10211) TaxID=684364 RepID=F4PDX4_BATDJ|nr:uncharacterized protein BATDEDRAFT_28498 [Batrachochytrium dendrobatidis JAM81]EGF76626.1 hypothetical protein BATDEDRAFT_28498 [Batrachochytrium dendrobatidis JAM81]|eukprot:XP_006682832.1 hypothetical protein BATDEDRAFT_28498 [Batrachochytrium dendrobatidis JAM81]
MHRRPFTVTVAGSSTKHIQCTCNRQRNSKTNSFKILSNITHVSIQHSYSTRSTRTNPVAGNPTHSGMGGIFSKVSDGMNPSDFNSPLETHSIPMDLSDGVEHDLKTLKVSSILPNDYFLSGMFKKGRFNLQPKKLRQLTQLIIDECSKRSPEDLSTMITEKFPDAQPKDLYVLIGVLQKHSTPGEKLAFALSKVCMHRGDMDAELKYAAMLMTGVYGVKRDQELGMKHLRSLADRKHGPALYMLAMRAIQAQHKTEATGYWLSTSSAFVVQDLPRALKYLTLAHEQGTVEATYLLGSMYLKGRGTFDKRPDVQKAHTLYLEAAGKGLAIAQHDLASMYYEGTSGIDRNVPLGLEYWTMAAEGGFALSQMNIAKARITGLEIAGPGGGNYEKDWVLAREMLERALESSDKVNPALAQDVKQLIEDLDELEKQNPEEAKKYKQKATKRKSEMCLIL